LLSACNRWADQQEHPPADQVTAGDAKSTPKPGTNLASSPFSPDTLARFEHLSLEQGLSQSSVFCMLQDSRGFLWICTQDGLNKYDGYDVTVYRPIPGDAQSLSDSYILSLHEDRDRKLWIGTYGRGLNRLDLDTGQITRLPFNGEPGQSLAGGVVHAIAQDSQGALWIGTDRGLNRYDPESQRFEHYEHRSGDPEGLADNRTATLLFDSDGYLWIGTAGGGLDRFDPDSERFAHFQASGKDPYSLGSNFVTAIHQDNEGMLWIGTANAGLDRLDPATGRFTHYRHDPDDASSLGSNVVTAIQQDPLGQIWVGTENRGLSRYDPDTKAFSYLQHDPRDPNSLGDNWISALYLDQAGILWVGTLGAGLSYLGCPNAAFMHYRADPYTQHSLSDGFVWALHEDQEGSLWVGTHGAGLDTLDRNTGEWHNYRHRSDDPNSLGHDVVRALAEDQKGMLWIGTDGGGLDRYDPETRQFTHYRNDPSSSKSLSNDIVLELYVDFAGTLWIGTRNGLNKMDGLDGTFSRYAIGNGVVRAIHRDDQDRLWIGSETGLYRLNLKTGELAVFQEGPQERGGLSVNSILSITEDVQGTLWLGTFGGGLNRLDPNTGQVAHYREAEGLPNNIVYGILKDDRGHLWMSTNAGISMFDPETSRFTNYGVADGLQSKEFNAGAFLRSSSGEMLFGGVNGFNAFHPDLVKRNPYLPPVVFTALRQGGTDLETVRLTEGTEQVTLRWPDNSFEFEAAALSFCQPERNQYAYYLEGLDRSWIHTGTQRSGRYTNLPGKTYMLRVRGSNNDGVWNNHGAKLSIKVIPPFWATWWFRGLAIFALVVTVVAGYRLRVRSIEARSRDLEIQVAERTRTLAERTRETERRKQELEALYRADAELHRHLSLDKVLQALVDIAVDILQADKSALLVWDQAREVLVVRFARGYQPETINEMRFAPDQGTVGRVASTGKPLAVKDARTDPRVSKREAITEPEGIRSFMQVPIEISGKVFGVFSADYTQPRAFGQEEKRLFLALAQRAGLAIDTAQLHEKSQELAVVEERNRLARDLHDAVTQTLFSSSLIAEALPELWETDPAEGRKLLRDLRQLSRGALAEMRTLLLELRPTSLAETPLPDLLRQLGDAVTGRTGVPVRISVNGHCHIHPELHAALYRIAQEALNNVVKHACASQVSVDLNCISRSDDQFGRHSTEAELRVSDNGCGFDLDRVPADRLGLGIIHERAQAIGAQIEVQTQLDQGTTILVAWKASQDDQGATA
jgi:ligand-binding sensor domain-containing protein/signal transduction histidine kinase